MVVDSLLPRGQAHVDQKPNQPAGQAPDTRLTLRNECVLLTPATPPLAIYTYARSMLCANRVHQPNSTGVNRKPKQLH